MPLFGSHLSIAGGLHKAVEAAAELGLKTVQIFTHSPSQWGVKLADTVQNPTAIKGGERKNAPVRILKNSATGIDPDRILTNSATGIVTNSATKKLHGVVQWQPKPLADDAVRRFREAIDRLGIKRPCAHDSYLINLATPDDLLWHKSVEGLVAELLRAESLGLDGVVMHPGSFVASSESEGQRRIVKGLNEVHRRTSGVRCECWLETTAGQGTNLGHRFEQIAFLLNEVREPRRLGVCVDSCHIFAAGYALQTKSEYKATMDQFDKIIGIQHIRAWHLNDSKKPFGSRVDRHEHIGEGCLGLEPFRNIVNDPRFADTPMYLETEKGERDGQNLDAMNLATLVGLMSKPARRKR